MSCSQERREEESGLYLTHESVRDADSQVNLYALGRPVACVSVFLERLPLQVILL